MAVIPYARRMEYSLKNVAGRWSVKVFVSAPREVVGVCASIHAEKDHVGGVARCIHMRSSTAAQQALWAVFHIGTVLLTHCRALFLYSRKQSHLSVHWIADGW